MSDAHEPLDAARRPLVIGTLVTLIGTALGTGVAVLLLLEGRAHVRLDPGRPRWYQSVPVEVNEVEAKTFYAPTDAELQKRAAEEQLASYRWVDRPKGIAAVPIEVAIETYLRTHDASTP